MARSCARPIGTGRCSTRATGSRSFGLSREDRMHDNTFEIAGQRLGSRLILGTAGYPTQQIMREAVEASGCSMVTLSVRRISLAGHGSDTVSLLSGTRFLPNTAG